MSQSGKSGDSAKSNGIEDEQKPQKKQAKHDSGAADLEKVTDYVEESELNTQNVAEVSIVITSLFITNTHLIILLLQAMNLIGERKSKENAEREARKKELDKVVIRKEDVELIMNEMEIPRNQAELSLRENKGDVVKALTALTD